MKRNLVLALILAVPLAPAVALGDPEEGDFQPVEGLENWEHRFDIADYEEGKYNLVVRGVDEAGNVTYEGPYNVFVDPASDMPIVNISNPTPRMRVATDLNVIGTCMDDDAVERVEVRLDDGEYRRAEGTDFWSFLLDVDGLADGDHLLHVRGVDNQDNTGEPQTVSFQLDKKAPTAVVTSLPGGSLARGTVRLAGRVEDSNGVEALSVRTGAEGPYEPARLSFDKNEKVYSFDLKVDTEKLEDGPHVFWFKAVDAAGSVGRTPFLLFVDNAGPTLKILSPQPGAAVNGTITVSGTAADRIGVESLTYVAGDDTGDIELVPGNPYWTKEFDLSAQKGGGYQIDFACVDYVGNRESVKLKLKLDPEPDMPTADIRYPTEDAVIRKPVSVVGFLIDDDGGQAVIYSADGGGEARLPAERGFALDLPDLAPGRHEIVIRGVDTAEVEGEKREVAFTVAGPPPAIAFDELMVDEVSSPFLPGASAALESKVKLGGAVRLSGGGKAVYTVQGSAPKSLPLKKSEDPELLRFEIPLSKDLPAGRIDVAVEAEDVYGAKKTRSTYLFKEDPAVEPADELVIEDARIDEQGGAALTAEEPLYGRLRGDAIASVELDPPTELVTVSHDDSVITIAAGRAGKSAPTSIRVRTAGGAALAAGPYLFLTDSEPPEITVESPKAGFWSAGTLELAGTLRDAGGIQRLEYSLDGEAFQPMDVSAPTVSAGAPPSFSRTVSLSALEDGNAVLTVRATDGCGNTCTERIPFQKDSRPPVVSLTAPSPDEAVNGLITLIGTVEDRGVVSAVEFSGNGESFEPVGSGRDFHFDLNLARYEEIPERFLIRAVDAAGNATLFEPPLNIDALTDRPTVEIQVPAEGEVLRNSFSISGMAFDDDQVASISYRIDGGGAVQMPGANSFSIPIDIDDISDNEHTVEVTAVDVNGARSETVSSSFYVSKSEPFSTLESPPLDQHVKGVVEITGRSEDPNGIEAAYLSYDNGLTFSRMDGAEQWSYRLDTRLLSDGIQAILVKAVDATGTAGLYNTTVNIDNEPPEIMLDKPLDGSVFTESIMVDGRGFDNIGMASLGMALRPIAPPGGADGEAAPAAAAEPVRRLDLPTEGVFAETVDIRDLPSGWYNLELDAADRAANRRIVSRNIVIAEAEEAETIELIFPAAGARLAGYFTVSGRVVSRSAPEDVLVLMDGRMLSTAEVNENGYFRLDLEPTMLAEGDHVLQVEGKSNGDTQLASEERGFSYTRSGAWARITSASAGDFVTGRPYLEGEAGYYLEPADDSDLEKQNRVQRVEVSFDNGKSYRRAEGREQWRYRLETQEIPNGTLRILVKATYASGATSVAKTVLDVDTRRPEVALLSPEEGGRFNDEIQLLGTAHDESGLQEVTVSLRPGDKSRYGVPEFIQGLYLDAHTLGATFADVGLGLTFFDDNVKLQAQAGMSPPGRFSGLVLGAKLLANVATVPFSYFFGPSWDFFSMSVALGANFSYFTMSEDSIAFTEDGLVLAAVVGQLEFARFRVPDWRMFHTYSLYTEWQLWFISSDVEGGLLSKLTFGFRLGLF